MRLAPLAATLLFAGAAAAAQLPPVSPSAKPPREVALIGESQPLPPPTPQQAASSELHGVSVADPYRWLENPDDPAVRQWIAAQNAYTEAALAAMPQGKALTARVRQLAITSTARTGPMLAGGTLFYLQQTPPQPQPVLMAKAWPDGAAKVLVDPNTDHGGTAITAYWPSPRGRYLAYGTAEGGSELTTIRVLDVVSGKTLPDTLPWAGGGTTPQGLAWDADERGFSYVRFAPPAPGQEVEQFHATLVHHALGQAAAADRVVFGQGYSKTAEYVLVNAPASAQAAVLAYDGDGGPAEVFLQHGDRFTRVLDRGANVRTAAWANGRLYAAAFRDAPRGRIVAIGDDGKAVPVLAEREGAIQQIAPLGDGFLVVRSWGPDWWVEQYGAGAKFVRRLPLPEHGIGIGEIASESGQPKALISYSGWTTPARWAEYDGNTGTLKTVFEVKPAADYSKVVARRIDGTSKDGTKIPVTVLSLPGTTANGKRPAILYSYGGFDLPVKPGFIGPNLAWLEHGGVLAYANIRGGNENGQLWHAQGQQLHKQNVFDDFHAAALALIDARWTNRAHLGILGGSNGGLLMGTQIVQHPGDYRAVVARVGIYDMLRHETDFANGPYNIPEYGSIADPAQFKATLAYSPLQHVQANTAYPAVLLTTGENDPRVAPWQSRKFAAALQNATASPRPILLLTRMNAGHGVGAPFSQRVGDTAIGLTFFAHELGLGVEK
ncbi:peptidase S9 [Rhodanobacter thiooxydans]|uniref:prolyl oligopeptidase n=1 Tax=Rhodanobacter thiooxydans TaxID=416169 RepID=A0A154QM70_9GAMM|nr:prolyl oligopeptidase family serine peptidase [Rhodanobacter thiooxydans]EIL97936.1 prolyl endopeptidase [Rhodanobacter thiooxydans LCS2]KZC24846.1 peptidase S9 [Rhodanobacter thiooxydans]MCW0203082.1 prolyl oligopeptidase family serine peptidase [Rhodanobacter thiooxydans]